jgi:hypothetical protein
MTNISESRDKEVTLLSEDAARQHFTATMGKQWAAVIRLAMLRDPKHKGCRINKIIERTRKDKIRDYRVQHFNLFRRYRDRYSTF